MTYNLQTALPFFTFTFYNVFGGTLSLTQSINQSLCKKSLLYSAITQKYANFYSFILELPRGEFCNLHCHLG